MMRLGKKMERCEIVYHMSADASIDGISARDVADVIVSFADAVEIALKESGDEGELHVNVKPFQQGSFITEFVLTYSQTIVNFFTSPEGVTLSGVLTALGFVGVRPDSVTNVIRKVRGRIDKCKDNGNGTYEYGERGDTVTVDERTHKMIQSPEMAKSIRKIAVAPIVNIDKSINISIQSSEEFRSGKKEAGAYFDQSDIPDMDTYERIAIEGIPEEHEDIVSTMHRIPVHPSSGPYDGGESGYSFTYMGEKWSRVQMRDLDFRMKMESGKVRFMMRDLLIVDLEVIQSITKSGKESVRRTITKVHEYRPYEPPEQMTIEDAEADMRSNVLP